MSKIIDSNDFEQTYQRFLSQKEDQEIKLKILREEKTEKELKGLTLVPKINKNSIAMFKSNKTFLERQASFEKKRIEKNKKMLEEKKKKEDEIIKQSRNTKGHIKDISSFVTHCYDWENKKKEKINKLKKENENKESKILKTNMSFRQRPSEADLQSAFERLYKDDVLKRKQNQSVLNCIFTPSFKPQINSNRNKLNKTERTLNMTQSNFDMSNELDISMEQIREVQHSQKIDNAIRNKLFKKIKGKSKINQTQSILNRTCDVLSMKNNA